MSDPPGLHLAPLTLDGPGTVTLDGEVMPSITAALDAAMAGSVVEVGRGRYTAATETFPLRVGPGVTLRGPRPPDLPRSARKLLPTPTPATIVADSTAVVVAGGGVTLAHLTIRARRAFPEPVVAIGPVEDAPTGASPDGGVVVDTCAVTGDLAWQGPVGGTLRWTTVESGRLTCHGVVGLAVTGGGVGHAPGPDPLVQFVACTDVRLEAAAIGDGARTVDGVEVVNGTGVLIGGCSVVATHDAVRVTDSRDVTVSGNRLRGGRAVHLVSCHDGEVTANGIEWADEAVALEACRDVTVGTNHIADTPYDTGL